MTPYRSGDDCPILTSDLHPAVYPRCLFFVLLGVIGRLGFGFWRNRGKERQEFILKCVKVKA
jgi:hypothetical protein